MAAPITVSAGIAAYTPEMQSQKDLLEAADRALYAAKRGGRDTVHVFAGASESRPKEAFQVVPGVT